MRCNLSSKSFQEDIANIEKRISPTDLARYLGFPIENGLIRCPFHSGDSSTMECNDEDRTFHCRTENCDAHKSIVDLVDFFCHVRDIPYFKAIDELATLDHKVTRPESRSSKGFGSIDELLEFIRRSQVYHQYVRQHIWRNEEKRAQKVIFKFVRNPDAPDHLEPQLIFHGYFYRGKWFRTRLAVAREPLPYLWHLAPESPSIIICRDEDEADGISSLGLAAVAVSSLGQWEGTHSKLFRGLGVVLLSDPDEDGRRYQSQAKKDLMPLVRSLRILEIDRSATQNLTAAQLHALIDVADDLLDPWEVPTATLASFDAIPPFQAEEMLPESLRYHLTDLSEDLQCPIDMLAAPALAGLSVLLGRKLAVQPKRSSPEFVVAAPLWCILIADPGQKKTQILKSALAPLLAIEDSFKQENRDRLSRRQADLRMLEARDRDLEARLAQATKAGQQAAQESLRDDLAHLEQQRADLAMVGPRQYITRDATPEKMLEILVQNPNGVMQLADEVPGWWRSLTTSNIDMRKLFLEGWGGLKILVQRKSYTLSGESILSVVGGAQPDWIAGIVREIKKDGRGNDGLINRFSLLINHEPLLGIWRYVDRPKNPEAKRWYEIVFLAFHELTTAYVITGWEKGQPNSICFSPEAQDIFIEWITKKENALRNGRHSRLLSSHVSKYTTLFASLSLIFHLILHFEGKTEDASEISHHAALLAKRWCEYLWFHAERTFAETDSQPLPVRTLARLILTGELKDRTPMADLLARSHMHLSTEKELSLGLKKLAERKIVRVEGPEAARIIRVNPHSLREVQKQS